MHTFPGPAGRQWRLLDRRAKLYAAEIYVRTEQSRMVRRRNMHVNLVAVQ